MKRAIAWFWLGGLAVFYLVGVVRALSTLLVVLAESLFLAFALEPAAPAVNRMQHRGIRRGLGTAVMFAAVGLLVGAFLAVVGTALASETTYLIDKAPTYIDDAEDWLNDTLGLSVEFDTVRDEFLEGSGAQDLFSRFADDLVNVGATVASPVETDAAWIGGKAKNMQALIRRQRVHGSNSHLTPVMGIRDRATGQIAAEAVARDDSATAQEFLSQTTPRVR